MPHYCNPIHGHLYREPARIGAVTESLPFTLETPTGDRLHGVADLADGDGCRPAIVVCHGFKGFFEWGFFPHLATLLAARGFHVVRFNFSGAGMRPGDELVSDLEAFRQATLSRDLEELLLVLEAVGSTVAGGRISPDGLGLMGHSRGGGTALLAAAGERWIGPIRALVTWSAVASFDRFSPEEKEEWRRGGELVIVNARTGQELPLGRAVLDDLEAHRDDLDLSAAAARRTAPWLIVHGDQDETVPIAEAHRLHSAARPPVEMEIIAGASHTFGVQHPFAGPTPQLVQAMNATQAWLRRHLG